MITDGFWHSFTDSHMGSLADRLAQKSGITREESDEYVFRSFQHCKQGWASGFSDVFEFEGVREDEIIGKLIDDKISRLRLCLIENGISTAAS
jgi:acetyl-CoA acetyltransferase